MRSLLGMDYLDLSYLGQDSDKSRPIAAWSVRGDTSDTEHVWAVGCLYEAQTAKRQLILLDPILKNDHGSWPWELFKQKGCEHCALWRRLGAPITIVENDRGECYMRDFKGNVLIGLKDVNTLQFPIPIPQNWDLLPKTLAEIIKASIEEGAVTPIFRRRR